MKKYLYSVLVMTLFAIGFAASDDSESSGSKESDFVGTYTIEGGYKLVINADKTARLTVPGGQVYAASVDLFAFTDYVTVSFSASNQPSINGTDYYLPVIGKEKDYFYKGVAEYKAKDENNRARITSFEPSANENK